MGEFLRYAFFNKIIVTIDRKYFKFYLLFVMTLLNKIN